MKAVRLIRGFGAALHAARIAWLLFLVWIGARATNLVGSYSGPRLYESGPIPRAIVVAAFLFTLLMAVGLFMWLAKGRRDVLIVADSILLGTCVLLPLETFLLIFALPVWVPDEARVLPAGKEPGGHGLCS